jgi:uncharacterized protein YaiI (UPF0178 family)
VKEEVYRVAERHALQVTLVANRWVTAPPVPWIERVVVEGGFDAADDWIAEHAAGGDIVITADIPLAARCLGKGARVLGTRGQPFTEDSIGDALASRALLSHLRDLGEVTGGPAPFARRDRSLFLQRLEEIVQSLLRGR